MGELLSVILMACTLSTTECGEIRRFPDMGRCAYARQVLLDIIKPEITKRFSLRCVEESQP